jgi:hypothetical protein
MQRNRRRKSHAWAHLRNIRKLSEKGNMSSSYDSQNSTFRESLTHDQRQGGDSCSTITFSLLSFGDFSEDETSPYFNF